MVWHPWGRLAGSMQRLRRLLGDAGATAALVALAGVLALGSLAAPEVLRPATVLAIPLLFGGLSLPLRGVRILLIATLVLIGLVTAARGWHLLQAGSVLIYVAVAVVSYEQARRRDRLGVRRARPDRILFDLRERLRVQGEVPPLPPGWGIEVELRPADDSGMAGDFVASRVHTIDTADGPHVLLDLALVDVSGKGVEAGTRACCCPAPWAACSARCRRRTSSSRPTATCCSSAGQRVSPPRRTCGWT
jgi:hypothetical protein